MTSPSLYTPNLSGTAQHAAVVSEDPAFYPEERLEASGRKLLSMSLVFFMRY